MASLRKGHCYSRVVRAYTRKSRYKKKAFIKAAPSMKIIKFNMGDSKKKFEYRIDLVSKDRIQIRQNALESSRILVNRRFQKQLGQNYYFVLRLYPHHVLRENKMLTGAGADRMQSGMQRAFGRPVGVAAQVRVGQPIMTVNVDKKDVDYARKMLKLATPRLPCRCNIIVSENKN